MVMSVRVGMVRMEFEWEGDEGKRFGWGCCDAVGREMKGKGSDVGWIVRPMDLGLWEIRPRDLWFW